jgi:hypothetical protein
MNNSCACYCYADFVPAQEGWNECGWKEQDMKADMMKRRGKGVTTTTRISSEDLTT